MYREIDAMRGVLKMAKSVLPDVKMPKFLPKGMKGKKVSKSKSKNFVEGAIDTFAKPVKNKKKGKNFVEGSIDYFAK